MLAISVVWLMPLDLDLQITFGSILISVVPTVKRIVSKMQNFSSFTRGSSTHSLIWLQESNKTGEGLFFCGEGDVWLLLNTFHVFLIVKIQYSLKDQSTRGQILLSDVCVWLILFLGSSEIWGTAFGIGYFATRWKWGAAALLSNNVPLGALSMHNVVPMVPLGSHAAPKEAASRQKKGMDLSRVLSFLELLQVHNPSC